MTVCKGLAPPPRGRRNAHAQRCGALPEPGHQHCAAHLAARGMRRCPTHGWVETRTEHMWLGYESSATVRCAVDRCTHVFEVQPAPWGSRLGVMG